MANKLLVGIAEALDDEFGIDIEEGEIKQNFKTPSFYLSLKSFKYKKRTLKMFSKDHSIIVHYFPSKEDDIHKLLEITDRINHILKYVKVGDLTIRAEDIEINISDNVIVAYVKYNCFFKEIEEDIDLMKHLEQRRKHG